MEEVEYLCVWAWKRRGGWAGGFMGSMTRRKWEYRSIVVVNHTLSYYEMGTEDSETPRGSIDLYKDQASFQIGVPDKADGAPTPHHIVIHATKVEQSEPVLDSSGNVDSLGSSTVPPTTTSIEWKLCFDQQEDLMRLVSVINRILDQGGAFKQKDVDRFEHDFAKGDHIYRWEMIVCPPVIYPIQIHAIVLEAGRNCLVVADFGLTGYAKKKDAHFHHAEDNDEAMQDQILAAFRKLRPTDSTQRLNILTMTDQREIRKWFKAGYDEESMLAKAKAASGHHHIALPKIGKNVGKIFKRNRINSQDVDNAKGRDSNGSSPSKEFSIGHQQGTKIESEETREGDTAPPFVPLEETLEETSDFPNEDVEKRQSLHTVSSIGSDTEGTEATEEEVKQSAKQLEELPHSDPVEIVLARANFCLENMDLLPPYHVFFSNSECIAVWCKTGRWSTLQTAVWCSTNSVGALKTSTLTTIGVAAANPLLAPVIAIGGLLWVSAPMLILQKSRLAWEEYTRHMTDLFWDWAPNAVFVSAVENWTTILKHELMDDSSAKSPTRLKNTSTPNKEPLPTNNSDDMESDHSVKSVTDEKKTADDETAVDGPHAITSPAQELTDKDTNEEHTFAANGRSTPDLPVSEQTDTLEEESQQPSTPPENESTVDDASDVKSSTEQLGHDGTIGENGSVPKPKTFRILNANRTSLPTEETSDSVSEPLH